MALIHGKREALPAEIRNQMKLWRMGLGDMPKDYITWHQQAAMRHLAELRNDYGITVCDTDLVSDGWFDGMRVLQARVKTPSGQTLVLKWSDSNRGFMKKHETGGSTAVSENDLL